jgi:hypothetical protein
MEATSMLPQGGRGVGKLFWRIRQLHLEACRRQLTFVILRVLICRGGTAAQGDREKQCRGNLRPGER